MTSEDANAAARKEVTSFWKGRGPYNTALPDPASVDLFLERNHVVRIPEEGLLEVTRLERSMLVNGEFFGDSSDPFDWQQTVEVFEKHLAGDAGRLQKSVLNLEKAKAVLAFLTQEQEAEKQRSMAREKRLDELAQAHFEKDFSRVTGPKGRALLVRIVELEEKLAAKP